MVTYLAAILALALLAALGLRDFVLSATGRRVRHAYGAVVWLLAAALCLLIWFNPDYWQSSSALFSRNVP